MAIKIDPEFRSAIPPLRAEEREQLEANLIAEGCRDALVIWKGKGIILDGHNRYDICKSHKIEFKTIEITLPDRESAADWIDANQLARRNLTPDQYALLRGRRYNRTKKKHGGERKASPQNEDLKTADRLAAQHGVSHATIERDGQFAAAVDTLKAVDSDIEAKIVTGKAPPKGAIVEAAKPIKEAEKAASALPLLSSKKDVEASQLWEEAKEEAEAILSGKRGSIAQAKRERTRAEKAAKKAETAAAGGDPDIEDHQKHFLEAVEEIDDLTRAVSAPIDHGGYGGFPRLLSSMDEEDRLILKGKVKTLIERLERWFTQIPGDIYE